MEIVAPVLASDLSDPEFAILRKQAHAGHKQFKARFSKIERSYSSRNVLAGSILAIFNVGKMVATNVTNKRVSTTTIRFRAS